MTEKTSSRKSAVLKALDEAHRLAVSPFVFQALATLDDIGALEALNNAYPAGLTVDALKAATGADDYTLLSLTEVAKRFGILDKDEKGAFTLTDTGVFFVNDRLVHTNFRFTRDVCYEGLKDLTASFKESRPAGLKVFGDWPTIYPGIQFLPGKARESWFDYDHLYSDKAFPQSLPLVFSDTVRSITDVGGNTGKWARLCAGFAPDIDVHVIDLPPQCDTIDRLNEEAGVRDRITTHPMNVLEEKAFPKTGTKAWWMSQFLDCFSPAQIVLILKKARAAMDDDARLFILEPFIGRQRFDTADASLAAMSLYFTAMANGTSRFYPYDEFATCLEAADFEIEAIHDNLGSGHTLLVCRKKEAL